MRNKKKNKKKSFKLSTHQKISALYRTDKTKLTVSLTRYQIYNRQKYKKNCHPDLILVTKKLRGNSLLELHSLELIMQPYNSFTKVVTIYGVIVHLMWKSVIIRLLVYLKTKLTIFTKFFLP